MRPVTGPVQSRGVDIERLADGTVRGGWWFFAGPMSHGDWSLVIVTAMLPLDIMAVFIIIRRAGSVFLSTVSDVDILPGIGWGMLIFWESHSAWIWGALVCLMAGLFMVTKPERADAASRGR